jgi:hypothetical protein
MFRSTNHVHHVPSDFQLARLLRGLRQANLAVPFGGSSRPSSRESTATTSKLGGGSPIAHRRTHQSKARGDWHTELIADLGGLESLCSQERALVDLAVRTKLFVERLDAWLLQELVRTDVGMRSLLPVFRERTELANALARYLIPLGLKRRSEPATCLADYLASHDDDDSATASDPVMEAAR